ncbi:MAG: hypothetical protein ACLRIS_10060 [Flavonifractor plautii]
MAEELRRPVNGESCDWSIRLAASYLLHGQIGLLGNMRCPGGAGGAPPALCRPDFGAGILNNASEARGRASEAKIPFE